MHATMSGTAFWTTLNRITRRSWLFVLAAALMALAPALRAQQVAATVSGTVTDPKGAVVQGATVTVTDEKTNTSRNSQTGKDGTFSVPNLLPSTYTVKVVGSGFAPKALSGIELHSGDDVRLPTLMLAVGAATDTVTVTSLAGQVLTMENGQRTTTLNYRDVEDMALTGRDASELLKVLPGSVETSNNVYNDLNATTGTSALGNGLGVSGAPYDGGSAIEMDGANVIDPGADFSALATINPEMTQEIQVQTTDFGADQQAGPVVINATGKSGGDHLHGEAYFNARNDAFNANDWVDNHNHNPKAGAAYYYPGGSFGGPIPYTHKKAFYYAALELPFQNQGNGNIINGFIPSPEMLGGDFSTDNADNLLLCPYGFYNGNTNNNQQPGWCQNIAPTPGNNYATWFPDGTQPYTLVTDPAPAIKPANDPLTQIQGASSGGHIPNVAPYIDPNMIAFTKNWPGGGTWNSPYILKNATAILNNGGDNYRQVVVNHDNGWIAHGRIDYNWNSTNQFYISYQQGFDRQLSGGYGGQLYGGGALQYPGGGLYKSTYSKILNGHYVHIFSPTLTNEAIASWVWGNIPIVPNNPSANFRSTLGASFGCVYCANPKYMPTFTGSQNWGYPGITQGDTWEPNNYYIVQKATPTFADNLTKVWGRQTWKFGALAANTDNYQGNQTGAGVQGQLSIGGTPANNTNLFAATQSCATNVCGSPNYTGTLGSYNPLVNMLMGDLNNYNEASGAPLTDVAEQQIAFYANDQIKVNKQLSIEVGGRFEHMGYWYDRDGHGLPVFYANRVLPDFYSGKSAPGFYWHSIDNGVPLSGHGNRFGFLSPRLGVSYDIFGNGKTVARGGWGAYRFTESSNDALLPGALNTSLGVQNFSANPQNNHTFLASQIGQLGSLVANCQVECASVGQAGFAPNDYGIPLTYSYNFTIDQKIPWGMLLDVAYVGNHTKNINANGGTSGGNFSNYDNQNKTPLGAYFNPDPITGVTACNPENLSAPCSPANTDRDYRPYGVVKGLSTPTNPSGQVYGTNGVTMIQHIGYSNYNALQATLVKRAGPVTLNASFTWDKSLGTVVNWDPFHIHPNNTYDNLNRPYIFNSTYIYREPNFFHGNRFIGGAVNGWTISGVTLWQEGTNTYPGISIQYDPRTFPATPNMYGLSSSTRGVGASTFFGTNAGIVTGRPQLTCNPRSGRVSRQLYRPCFTAAPFGSSGGFGMPFNPGVAFLENDLAIYKTFTIHEQNKVQFRVSAFNWLNHPLEASNGQESTTEYWFYNWQTHALYPNDQSSYGGSGNPGSPIYASTQWGNAGGNPSNLFGVLHGGQGNFGPNNERIMEFDVKYTF